MNAHNNKLGGEEIPPSREVIIDLEMDCRTHNTNTQLVYGSDNLNPESTQAYHIASASNSVYTRYADPFKPQKIEQILLEITVGPDTMLEEHRKVKDLIAEFADCFTLAMSEVNTVPGAVHKLNILPGTKFHMKVGQ
jgi:hypothetical protein